MKHITVIEKRDYCLNLWRKNLSRLGIHGFEVLCLAEIPEPPAELLRPYMEGKKSFIIIGDTGDRRPSGCHIHDALSALGFEQFVAMASELRTSRFDLGNPAEPHEERAEEHALLLSAFLSGHKTVGPLAGVTAAATRFDYLPSSMRRANLDLEIFRLYKSIALR